MQPKPYKDFTEKEEYNPENKRNYKIVGLEGDLPFILYEDEAVDNFQPGNPRAIIVCPKRDGKGFAKTGRLKKGYKMPESERLKMSQSIKKMHERKKQIRELSVMVKELLADPKLPQLMVKELPPWAKALDEPNAAALIIGSAIMKAMDTKNPGQIQAAEFLHKVGWGQKIDVDVSAEGSFFKEPTINFTVIEDREQFQKLKAQEEKESLEDSAIEGEIIDKE